MEHALKIFPNGLPNLEQLLAYNKGKDVPPETSWIWGKDDEVGGWNCVTTHPGLNY